MRASAQREQAILTLVRPYLPVQVPDWQIHTDELIAYPLLNGKPAGTIDPELQAYPWEIDAQNLPDPYLQSLGKTLAALHSIEHRAVATLKQKPRPFTHAEVQQILETFKGNRYYAHYYPYVYFLLSTGCRPAEAAGLALECH